MKIKQKVCIQTKKVSIQNRPTHTFQTDTPIHFKLEATKDLHVIPVIEIPRVA